MTAVAMGATGLLLGALLGRLLWGGRTARQEECIVFCSDGTEHTKTCKSGETGDCLEELLTKCPGQS